MANIGYNSLNVNDVPAIIQFISSDGRDDWLKVGMGLKAEYGEDAKAIWFDWSSTSPSFKKKDAESAWASFRNKPGGVTMGTVLHMAKSKGWSSPDKRIEKAYKFVPGYDSGNKAREQFEDRKRTLRASVLARRIYDKTRLSEDPHPYLETKGLDDVRCRVDYDNNIILPMFLNKRIMSVQRIGPDGEKMFLPYGGQTVSTSMRINYPAHEDNIHIYTEGYATGLTVLKALTELWPVCVVVVFNAFNLVNVVLRNGRSFVVADNDEAGLKYARKTGVPYWFPPIHGMDANDLYTNFGWGKLQKSLRKSLTSTFRSLS